MQQSFGGVQLQGSGIMFAAFDARCFEEITGLEALPLLMAMAISSCSMFSGVSACKGKEGKKGDD